jgi:hypothetical protein
VPGAPINLLAAPGPAGSSGEANVSWTAPPGTDPSVITSYTVTPLLGGAPQTPTTVTALATSVTVTGLTDGLSYTFEVSATDALGTGPNSVPSNAVVPVGPLLGNPNNNGNNAVILGTLGCGHALTASGTAANDGSNAWYQVTFTEPVLSSCNLNVSLSATVIGLVRGSTTVFDLSAGAPGGAGPIGVTSATVPSPGPGTTTTYFIHVYDPGPGAVVTTAFTLTLQS